MTTKDTQVSYSIQRAVSDGSLTRIVLTVEYLSKDDIGVYINGVIIPEGTDETYVWNWDGDDIVFASPVPSGVEVMIRRDTDKSSIMNLFSGRAEFSNKTMDDNFKQLLFIAQEYSEGVGLNNVYNDVDLHGYKLINVGEAENDNDALTYGQYKEEVQGTYQNAQLAKTSAESAARDALEVRTNTTQVSQKHTEVLANAKAVADDTAEVSSNTQLVLEAKNYIQDLVNIEPVKDGVACARVTWTVSDEIPAGTVITLPDNVSYVVGRKHIFVSYEGIVASPSFFNEIGTFNTVSKQISLTFDLKEGSELSVWVVPLGTIDQSLYDRVKTLEDALADLSRRVAYATDADDK